MKYNPIVDAYISKSAEFAKPILEHLRALVHKVCPEVEETIKWGFPNFDYMGPMFNMAAFKNHCAFGFWKGALIPKLKSSISNEPAMGNLGKITSLKDLPSNKTLIALLREAVKLNEEGIKLPKKDSSADKKVIIVPDYIASALKKNKSAQNNFSAFSYSNKKEYIEWITEAKTAATREKRISTMIEWVAEGKPRNWKYMKNKMEK